MPYLPAFPGAPRRPRSTDLLAAWEVRRLLQQSLVVRSLGAKSGEVILQADGIRRV